jgi:dienelactone hydrolase
MPEKKTHTVLVCPGTGGRPDSPKIKTMETVAKEKGFRTHVPDWRQVRAVPKYRAGLLKKEGWLDPERLILAGSSLGGLTVSRIAETREVDGLFQLVPVLNERFDGSSFTSPKAKDNVIIHAWDDEYTEPVHVQVFATMLENARLHILPGRHSLKDHLDFIAREFADFLDRVSGKKE